MFSTEEISIDDFFSLKNITIFAALYKYGIVIATDHKPDRMSYNDNFLDLGNDTFIFANGPLEDIKSSFEYMKSVVEDDANGQYAYNNRVLHVAYALFVYLHSLKKHNCCVVSGVDPIYGTQLFLVNSSGYQICVKKFLVVGRFRELLRNYANVEYRADMTCDECMRFVEKGFGFDMDRYMNTNSNIGNEVYVETEK